MILMIIKKTLIYKIFISIPLSFILSYLYWKHIKFSILFTIMREMISSLSYYLYEYFYNKCNTNIIEKNKIYGNEKENIKIYLLDTDNDKYEECNNEYNTF